MSLYKQQFSRETEAINSSLVHCQYVSGSSQSTPFLDVSPYLDRLKVLIILGKLSRACALTNLYRGIAHSGSVGAGLRSVGTIALLATLTLGLCNSPASSQNPTNPAPQTGSSSAQAETRSVLRVGSKGNQVSEIQALLKLMGYYDGPVDGTYQNSTASAVSAFQQAAGLPADGIVGSDTWNHLLPASPSTSSASPASLPVARPAVASTANSPATSSPATNSPAATTPFPSPTATPAPSTSAPIPTLSPAPATPSPAPSPVPSPAPSSTPTPTAPAPAPGTNSRTNSGTGAAPNQPNQPNQPNNAEQTTPVTFPVLKIGTYGPAVSALQERLKTLGFFNGSADGVFGAETQAAVQAAQRNYNLEPDGIVGPATWAALFR